MRHSNNVSQRESLVLAHWNQFLVTTTDQDFYFLGRESLNYHSC